MEQFEIDNFKCYKNWLHLRFSKKNSILIVFSKFFQNYYNSKFLCSFFDVSIKFSQNFIKMSKKIREIISKNTRIFQKFLLYFPTLKIYQKKKNQQSSFYSFSFFLVVFFLKFFKITLKLQVCLISHRIRSQIYRIRNQIQFQFHLI